MSPLAKLDDAENAAFRAEVLHIMAIDQRLQRVQPRPVIEPDDGNGWVAGYVVIIVMAMTAALIVGILAAPVWTAELVGVVK